MSRQRKPRAFKPEEIELAPTAEAPLDEPGLENMPGTPPARVRGLPDYRRGLKWGSLLFAAVGGLVTLALGVWLHSFIVDLFARQDLIGWVAFALLVLALFALLMIVLREALGLAQLARLGALRHEADSAARENDTALAKDAVERLKRLYHGRADSAWGLARLKEHEHDIMDAHERLRLAERALVAPLDPQARAIVAASAKRTSVVTAVSPAALIDMAFVAAENLRMLRRLSTLYGARPGTLALMKLARMVITHIVVTGGIAMGDDLIQQIVGHGLTARLSTRLGEGVFNGALTARIGLAAIDVCRPLPYLEVARPRFRELVGEVAGLRKG
jgi:putative membrane protein